MFRPPFKAILLLVAASAALGALSRSFFSDTFSNLLLGAIRNPAAYIFERVGAFRAIAAQISTVGRLSRENVRLKEENQRLLGERAAIEFAVQESDFLAETAIITGTLKEAPVAGGIFSISLGPAGYEVILNRGATDGIKPGDVVITGSGVLIGPVVQASARTSKVRFVTDSNFSVTAKVLGGQTAGIAKGNLQNGLVFDLIVQDDLIGEGDTVVSSGNDRIPAGLVIGVVTSVSAEGSGFFKKVEIRPSAGELPVGKVLIIRGP